VAQPPSNTKAAALTDNSHGNQQTWTLLLLNQFPFMLGGDGMKGRSTFGAESAHKIDDQAYQQQQADSAAADDRTAKVKPAAAEQKQQDQQDDD